jgi:hypothetical protein
MHYHRCIPHLLPTPLCMRISGSTRSTARRYSSQLRVSRETGRTGCRVALCSGPRGRILSGVPVDSGDSHSVRRCWNEPPRLSVVDRRAATVGRRCRFWLLGMETIRRCRADVGRNGTRGVGHSWAETLGYVFGAAMELRSSRGSPEPRRDGAKVKLRCRFPAVLILARNWGRGGVTD